MIDWDDLAYRPKVNWQRVHDESSGGTGQKEAEVNDRQIPCARELCTIDSDRFLIKWVRRWIRSDVWPSDLANLRVPLTLLLCGTARPATLGVGPGDMLDSCVRLTPCNLPLFSFILPFFFDCPVFFSFHNFPLASGGVGLGIL